MLESLIHTYGYLAIFVGTVFEGETILLLGGFAAYQGYLNIIWVVVIAAIGGFIGDQMFFYLGRKYNSRFTAKHPAWYARIHKAQELLVKFKNWLIFMSRFMYGLRLAIPFSFGMSPVSGKRFAVINSISALVWAVIFGVGGYLFGNAIKIIIGDIKRYEMEFMGIIIIIGGLIWFVYSYHYRKAD